MSFSNQDKTITLPFKEFLDYLLTYKEKVELKEHPHHADLVQAIDKEEVWTHIQRVDVITDKPLPYPIVWRKMDWAIDYQRQLLVKKESKERVRQWDVRVDNINRLCRAIMEMTMLPREMVEPMASQIVTERNEKAATNFGVKLKK